MSRRRKMPKAYKRYLFHCLIDFRLRQMGVEQDLIDATRPTLTLTKPWSKARPAYTRDADRAKKPA